MSVVTLIPCCARIKPIEPAGPRRSSGGGPASERVATRPSTSSTATDGDSAVAEPRTPNRADTHRSASDFDADAIRLWNSIVILGIRIVSRARILASNPPDDGEADRVVLDRFAVTHSIGPFG